MYGGFGRADPPDNDTVLIFFLYSGILGLLSSDRKQITT